jgi:hypothetical protein
MPTQSRDWKSGVWGAAVFPAEIFPMISDALVASGAKKTAVELLCANMQTYALYLPSLLKHLDLSAAEGFRGQRFAQFAVDALGAGRKFAHVKSLKVHSINEGDFIGSFKALWNGLVNLESLSCVDRTQSLAVSSLAWNLASSLYEENKARYGRQGVSLVYHGCRSGTQTSKNHH